MAATVVYVLSLIWAFLLSVVEAGEYCGDYDIFDSRYDSKYCVYGCCGYRNNQCCSMSAGIIAGICVGVGVFIFVIIITICICRRRRYQGVVYQNGPAANTMVVQSTTNQSGVVTTAGVQPGVTYPYYQYPGYANQGYPAAGYPQGTAYPQGTTYPPQPQPYAQGPPSYSEVTQGNGAGGVNNPGFQKN